MLRRSHFLSLIKQGTRFVGSEVKVEYRRGGKTARARLGITVSRRYGKAHARNRFKRIVREAFRQLAPVLPLHLELHVSPKSGKEPLTMQAILADLKKLLNTLCE